METLTTAETALLNDLVEINNDRIAGYANAIALVDATRDTDIISLFEKIGQQSQQFKAQLTPFAEPQTGKPVANQRAMGRLYNRWMDIKITIAGSDRQSVLSSCEKGEDVFRKIYADIYKDSVGMDEKIRSMIKSQGELQLEIHQLVKQLRDAEHSA